MTEIGYSLSSEEHPPKELVRCARLAEEAGFTFAGISDHYHPWTDRQGQSGFVWSVLGAIAQATDRLRLFTGVTCPIGRIHPAIVAQAAATVETLMPGRFMLAVGTGERLNEHILDGPWPEIDVRLEMLSEAVGVIRQLWEGGMQSHHGRYFTVENARIYSLPERPPPLLVAGAGKKSAELAGRIGDGFVGTAPEASSVQAFEQAGGAGKPRIGHATVCWAADEASARRTALEIWPNIAIPGQLGQELALPSDFEQVASLVTEDAVAELVACGPDPEAHLALIDKFAKAGYDHVYVHQIGPDQTGFLRFYEREILPKVA